MLFVSEISGCGLKYRIDNVSIYTTDIYPILYRIILFQILQYHPPLPKIKTLSTCSLKSNV